MISNENRIRVELPYEKLQQLAEIAKLRNQKQRHFGAMTYTGGRNTRGSLEAHMIGMVAEVAVAHYYEVDVDRRIFADHGDEGEDLTLPYYGKTQVKATTYWLNPWLRAEVEHDHDNINTYMLVCVDENNYSNVALIGQAPRSEVIQFPTKRCKDGGPLNYIGDSTKLYPIRKPPKRLLINFSEALIKRDQNAKVLFNEILERMS